MNRSLKTIAAFPTPEDAEVARIALEDEGIASFLEGATTVGMLWHVGGALGGVKLQVAEADAQRARGILAKTVAAPAEGRTCDHCGANLPPGFDVCWSCESSVEDVDQATLPSAKPEPAPTAPEDSEEETEVTAIGDAAAWRALAAAIIGIFLCPPLLNIYSVWILLKVGFQNPPMSQKGSRCYYAAMCLNMVVCCVTGWFLLKTTLYGW